MFNGESFSGMVPNDISVSTVNNNILILVSDKVYIDVFVMSSPEDGEVIRRYGMEIECDRGFCGGGQSEE